MKRDDFVDFFAVEPHQVSIHKRLENWAQWCFGRGGSSAIRKMTELQALAVTVRRVLRGIAIDGKAPAVFVGAGS